MAGDFKILRALVFPTVAALLFFATLAAEPMELAAQETCGAKESLDTDCDGVTDTDELRIGTKPDACDTDEDGLSDGVELGRIQPTEVNRCHGLQPSGTNFKRPHEMDPLNPDSDGDGLKDGAEDANGNGWLDPDESDPSIEDSDGDGLSDYVEVLGDFDGDGFADFDFERIKAGQKCSPPETIADIDCDGVPNSRDTDSDNDACSDKAENGWTDANSSGIPDVYDNQAKSCPETDSQEVAGGGKPSESPNAPVDVSKLAIPNPGEGDGAGACSLQASHCRHGLAALSVIFLIASLMVFIPCRCLLRATT